MNIRYIQLFVLLATSLLLTACVSPLFLILGTETTVTPPQITGDPQRGAEIFLAGVGNAPPCSSCHATGTGSFSLGLGPNLAGIADRASTRVDAMSAEQYIEASIIDPASFVVPGFRVSMFTDYALHLSHQDIADLVAYLMTLGSGAG